MNRCCCNNQLDYETRQMLASAITSALFTRVVIFTHKEWVADCGFIIKEQMIELPHSWERDEFIIEVKELFNNGWECKYIRDIFERDGLL